jgi:hypothetical protein
VSPYKFHRPLQLSINITCHYFLTVAMSFSTFLWNSYLYFMFFKCVSSARSSEYLILYWHKILVYFVFLCLLLHRRRDPLTFIELKYMSDSAEEWTLCPTNNRDVGRQLFWDVTLCHWVFFPTFRDSVMISWHDQKKLISFYVVSKLETIHELC